MTSPFVKRSSVDVDMGLWDVCQLAPSGDSGGTTLSCAVTCVTRHRSGNASLSPQSAAINRRSIAYRARWVHLMHLSPLRGVLQNDAAPTIIDKPPFLDLLQGPKAAEAGKFIVEAAISYAWGLRGAVDFTHGRRPPIARLRI